MAYNSALAFDGVNVEEMLRSSRWPSPRLLLINITKRPRQRTSRVADRNVPEPQIVSHGHLIVQCRIPRWRNILKRQRARDRPPPVLQILVLPCPPHSINLRMVKPKVRIRRGVVEVRPSVAANSVVAAEVDAELAWLGVLQ